MTECRAIVLLQSSRMRPCNCTPDECNPVKECRALRLVIQSLLDRDALLEAINTIRTKAYKELLGKELNYALSYIATIAEDAIAKTERDS